MKQVREAWDEFAEKKKNFQLEFQLLSLPFELVDHTISLNLSNPIQETLLQGLKIDLTTHLRGKLKNQNIQIEGHLNMAEEKKIMYTNREKFEYLLEKNPALKELKDRLGLDADY